MGENEKRKSNNLNDLDLSNWKDYPDLLTDSLWIINERDKSGAHSNSYHGNFIPQIPHQIIQRFTKAGDVVLDGFLGYGTTLIEAQRLGRSGIGIELQDVVANNAKELILSEEHAKLSQKQIVLIGDSREVELRNEVLDYVKGIGQTGVKLIILHPPYDDIIKFSDNPRDLSNSGSTEEFVKAFGDVVENLYPTLEKNGHIALVIGDKYSNSEWVPLGFYLMAETIKRAPGLILKSTVVKNMAGSRAKQGQEQLWRYRSLSGGFYVFKHEYIFLFKRIK